MPPEQAAYKAFEDFCNAYEKKYASRMGLDRDLEKLADILAMNAPSFGENGEYLDHEARLNSKWLEHYKRYKARQNTIEIRNEEIAAIEIDEEELDSAWKALSEGEIGIEAERVWRALRAKGSVHEIAYRAKVSLSTAYFWIKVFTRNKLAYGSKPYLSGETLFEKRDLFDPIFDLDEEPFASLSALY